MRKIIFVISVSLLLSADITESYEVKGMHCGYGCVNKIKSVMNSLDGIKSCDVSFEESSMTIEFDDIKMNTENILLSFHENTTYKAKKIEDEKEELEKKSFWNKIKGLFNRKS